MNWHQLTSSVESFSTAHPYIFWGALAVLLPAFRKAGLLMIAFYAFCQMELSRKYRIYVLPYAKGQIMEEARSSSFNLILDLSLILGAKALGWFVLAPTTLFNVALTYVVMFVWYDFWFYATHRLYHLKAFYFIHEQHHHSRVTSPWTAFNFGILERLSLNFGAIAFGILFSHFMPFALLGFGLYFVSNNVFNVMLHCNVELFPAGFAANRFCNWFFTPTFHALHHARFQRHYGLFTTIPDRLFNTLWPDYAIVQERAANGQGLTSFHEKLFDKDAHLESNKDRQPDMAVMEEASWHPEDEVAEWQLSEGSIIGGPATRTLDLSERSPLGVPDGSAPSAR